MKAIIILAAVSGFLIPSIRAAPSLNVVEYDRSCAMFGAELSAMTAKERKNSYKAWSDDFVKAKNAYEQNTPTIGNLRVEDADNLYTLCHLWLSKGRAFLKYKDDIGYVSGLLILRYEEFMDGKVKDYVRQFGTASTPTPTQSPVVNASEIQAAPHDKQIGKMTKSELRKKFEGWKERVQGYFQSGNPLMAAREWDTLGNVMWENREALGPEAEEWMQAMNQRLIQTALAFGQAAANLQAQTISGGSSSTPAKPVKDPMEHKCYRCGGTMYGTTKCPQCDTPSYGNKSILITEPENSGIKKRLFY